MKLKMILWNVRGLNDPQKHLVVKNFLHEWKSDVVYLQETKFVGMDRKMVCNLWNCPYMDWVTIDANQTASGVLIMCDRRVQEKLEDMVGTFFVLVRWQGVVVGFIWACLGIYGANENGERGVTYGMS